MFTQRRFAGLIFCVLLALPGCGGDDGVQPHEDGGVTPDGAGLACEEHDLTECYGACVSTLSDEEHCGDCDTTCDATEVCEAGSCVLDCGPVLTHCGDTCVDTAADPLHCGDCTTACDANEICEDGVCTNPCGDATYGTLAGCQACLGERCCPELAACDVGTPCADLRDCRAACTPTDPACLSACDAQHWLGVQDAGALDDCAETWCEDDCRLGDGVCETSYTQGTDGTACLTDHCCASFLPCWDDVNCHACVLDDTLAGCDTNALYQTYDQCHDAHCQDEMCDTGVGYPSFAKNTCMTASCCSSVTPCVANPVCLDCLGDPEQPGCSSNSLFLSTQACELTYCPDTACGTSLGYYDDGDPAFACNACLGAHCCTDLNTCVAGGTEPELSLCIACLADPNGTECTSTTISDAATDFLVCRLSHCSTECAGL